MNLTEAKILRLNAENFPPTPAEIAGFERHGITPLQIEGSDLDEILAHATDADAILVVSASLPRALIDQLEKCQVISRLGAGTDKIDVARATERGILVTNVPDFCWIEQAEHALALLLALVRKLPQMKTSMLAGEWNRARNQCRPIHRLNERTLGLVGFGGSAKELAKRALGFGLRVLASRQRMDSEAHAEAQQFQVELVDQDTLLATADYVSLHLPLNDHTYHLFDAEQLAKIKPGAYFINTARGAIVDEFALAAALKSGHLAGAGIDTWESINVHAEESGAPNHPLLEMENVIFTPHVAAFSQESSFAVGDGGVENLATVLQGYWPPHNRIVNADVVPRFPLEHGND